MKKNPTAAEMGRAGGKARAKSLTKEQRKEAAVRAIKARWAARNGNGQKTK